jgi:hypothetical protein
MCIDIFNHLPQDIRELYDVNKFKLVTRNFLGNLFIQLMNTLKGQLNEIKFLLKLLHWITYYIVTDLLKPCPTIGL